MSLINFRADDDEDAEYDYEVFVFKLSGFRTILKVLRNPLDIFGKSSMKHISCNVSIFICVAEFI